jgi:hypothetical protein
MNVAKYKAGADYVEICTHHWTLRGSLGVDCCGTRLLYLSLKCEGHSALWVLRIARKKGQPLRIGGN